MQIEEQKLKIQNTPNKGLRVGLLSDKVSVRNCLSIQARFEMFLEELEKQRTTYIDQVSNVDQFRHIYLLVLISC